MTSDLVRQFLSLKIGKNVAKPNDIPESKTDSEPRFGQKQDDPEPQETYRLKLVWKNILLWTWVTLSAIYGVYLCFTSAKIQTILWAILLFHASGIGITAGAHRLWAHRSYKAKWPLKVILIIFNAIAFTFPVERWVREHRVHHKFSDTNADPYNRRRGFFFSHIGWLFCRKHPDVKEKGRGVDLTDIYQDQFVQFQNRHYFEMVTLFSIILPTLIPVYFWGETLRNAWYVAFMLRYSWLMNAEAFVNSLAHSIGEHPYDSSILPGDSLLVSMLTIGEGWHNYHHTFPWDYKTGAPGSYFSNPTTAFIDFFSKIGWAYDLKIASPSLVQDRMRRTGTKTRENSQKKDVWGWGDEDMPKEDMDDALILRKKG